MRRYEIIWNHLKTSTPGQWVEVKVSSASQIETIFNMVVKEKSRANLSRKRMSLPAYGILEVDRRPEEKKILFRLKNAGAQL